MLIRTIVTDCDDTLLNDEMRISPFTLEVLKKAHEKGVRVILASGRAAASILPFVRQLDFKDPYIACNGAAIMDGATHQPLDEVLFTVAQARECAAFFKENNMYTQYYLGDMFYYSEEGPFNRAYAESTLMRGVLKGDLTKAIDRPIAKLLGIDAEEHVAAAFLKAKARFGDSVSISLSKPYFLEMNPKGASKGEALERLKRYCDIDPQTTMAFGDSLNDMTMLKWAKYGVAMANARDEVKNAVGLVCPSNTEDGVAHMILRHVLKEEPFQ